MADVGDRVEMLSKAGSRQGVVRRVSGTLVTVEWDTGGQTTVIPAPGVMSVVGGRRPAPAKKKAAPVKKQATAAPAKKKGAPAKKKAAPVKKKAARAKKKATPVKKKAATKKKR